VRVCARVIPDIGGGPFKRYENGGRCPIFPVCLVFWGVITSGAEPMRTSPE